MNNRSPQQTLRSLSLIGILSALTFVLYLVRIPVVLFLEINFSEIVMFIGGFSLGPVAAIVIGFFRLFLALPFTTTGGVGELADLLYSLAFVLPGAIYYSFNRTKQGAFIGFMLGMIAQLLITSLLNALVITDLYLTMFLNLTGEEFVAYIQTVIPQVKDPYWSLVLWMYLPFNIFKNTVIIALTLITYKRVHLFIKKIR